MHSNFTLSVKKVCAVVFLIANIIILSSISTQAQVSRFTKVDGRIYTKALFSSTNTLYVGGSFSRVNTYITGNSSIIDPVTGLPEEGWPEINGTVYACVSDRQGGGT